MIVDSPSKKMGEYLVKWITCERANVAASPPPPGHVASRHVTSLQMGFSKKFNDSLTIWI